MTPAEAAEAVKVQVQTDKERIEQQVIARYPRASNVLRNAALSVLANPSPSAPGSPPGVRSGHLKNNWHMSGGAVCITSGMGYAGYLEHGTRKMAARPFVDKIQQTALPNVMAIFAEIGG